MSSETAEGPGADRDPDLRKLDRNVVSVPVDGVAVYVSIADLPVDWDAQTRLVATPTNDGVAIRDVAKLVCDPYPAKRGAAVVVPGSEPHLRLRGEVLRALGVEPGEDLGIRGRETGGIVVWRGGGSE